MCLHAKISAGKMLKFLSKHTPDFNICTIQNIDHLSNIRSMLNHTAWTTHAQSTVQSKNQTMQNIFAKNQTMLTSLSAKSNYICQNQTMQNMFAKNQTR